MLFGAPAAAALPVSAFSKGLIKHVDPPLAKSAAPVTDVRTNLTAVHSHQRYDENWGEVQFKESK